MLDVETKKLDTEILGFIRKYGRDAIHRAHAGQAFQSLAFKIFEYQFRRNLNYQKFCQEAGAWPGALKSWKEIPAMPTTGFKELVLSTFPPRRAVKIFKTSGTTRQNHGAHFFDTLRLYDAAVIPVFKKYLIPGSVDFSFFFLMASPKEDPASSLSYMMGVVNKRFAGGRGKYYALKGDIRGAALLKDLEAAGRKKKVMLCATAFSLKSFLDFLKSKKASLRLKAGSRLMETGGFKGRMKEISKDALYAECEKRLGIKRDFCVSEYGMTELSSQFYDTTLYDHAKGAKRKPFKAGPAWLRTMVIDPRTGREARRGSIGILRHFDLANRGSVMAIQTEDLGRAVGEGFELIGRLPGADLRGCSLNYEEFLARAS